MSIHKVKGGHRVISRRGKNMGTFPSRAKAEKRLAQIDRFKAKTKKR